MHIRYFGLGRYCRRLRLVATALDVLVPLLLLEDEAAHTKGSKSQQHLQQLRSPLAHAASAAAARAAGTDAPWSLAAELAVLGAAACPYQSPSGLITSLLQLPHEKPTLSPCLLAGSQGACAHLRHSGGGRCASCLDHRTDVTGNQLCLNTYMCMHAGVPQAEQDLEKLAMVVYRGMLRALPASCRSWFGALRDRSLAVLIEVSCPECLHRPTPMLRLCASSGSRVLAQPGTARSLAPQAGRLAGDQCWVNAASMQQASNRNA